MKWNISMGFERAQSQVRQTRHIIRYLCCWRTPYRKTYHRHTKDVFKKGLDLYKEDRYVLKDAVENDAKACLLFYSRGK